jgi:hypothetical protein
MSAAATATLNAKAVTVLVTVALVSAAGIGGAVAGVGPTAGLDVPFAQQQDPTPTPETAVHLDPTNATVHVGETTTYDVVVANASGGVGEHVSIVSVDDPGVASITDVSLRGNQSAEATEVSIADDGSSANITAAPMIAADSGGVVVATVTLTGDGAGTTDIGLHVDELSTEAGDSYDITAATGSAITVEPNPDPALFRVSELNASHNATLGEPFNLSAAVTNDGDLEATQTVRLTLDRDGNGTLDDGVVASREITLAGHDRQRVTFTGVNVTDVDPGSHVYGVFTEDDSATGSIDLESTADPTPGPEATVLLRPSGVPIDGDTSFDTPLDSGDTMVYDVVVVNASGGVGAQDIRLDVDDPTHATIAKASVVGGSSDAATEIEYIDDGHAVNITAAMMDTDDNGTVSIASVTFSGHAVGRTDIALQVNTLGTEAGTAYNVTAADGTSIMVKSDYSSGSTSDDEDASTDGAVTPDEISQAKYGVAFENLGSQTSGEVQAIYNRQPFSGNLGPADVKTRNEISEARHNVSFSELDRQATIEVQNEYDAQFGAFPSDPAHTRDDISQAKYDTAFADLDAEQTGEALAIYNRQPLPGDVVLSELRTRDEITNDRYGQDFIGLSRGTTIDIQNDYDAQFGDADE